jgi:hypothetical protein
MPAAPDPSSPEAHITAMRVRFAELRKRQNAARGQLIILSLVIIVLFGAFAIATYTRVTGNFERSAVQKAVSDRLPQILPIAGEQLTKAATNALPVYKALATDRYEKVRTDLSRKALDRLYKIPEETGSQMSDRLHLSFDKALKRVEPDIKKAFPSLTDAQKQDILNVYFNDAIDARNKEIASHITNIYTAELVKVHNAFNSFDVPSDDNSGDPGRIHKDFLHTLLVLADYELLNDDILTVGTGASAMPVKTNRATPTTQQASAQ